MIYGIIQSTTLSTHNKLDRLAFPGAPIARDWHYFFSFFFFYRLWLPWRLTRSIRRWRNWSHTTLTNKTCNRQRVFIFKSRLCSFTRAFTRLPEERTRVDESKREWRIIPARTNRERASILAILRPFDLRILWHNNDDIVFLLDWRSVSVCFVIV